MSLNATPASERIHIGIFGKRNAGKSSVMNALTGQNLAVVSDVKGTTTDPVSKAMELLPLGPVLMIDTPGLDDEGELGRLRVAKSYQILNKTDIALLVVDAREGISAEDEALIARFEDKKIPYVLAYNKSDLLTGGQRELPEHHICVSAKTGEHIHELKELLAAQVPQEKEGYPIVRDLIRAGDFVVLVVPIDKAAPKGRLILPQQQTIRDILEAGAMPVVCRDTELTATLEGLGRTPSLVITDSQVFKKVAPLVPHEIRLTSFSILFARHKGELDVLAAGAAALSELEDGDTVLISEGCTHHRQCEDIGTVKLPRLIQKYTGKEIHFAFTSGTEFPLELSPYRMIIHCGGCTLNEREMKYRIACAKDAGIPMTNYGVAIACMTGILDRSIEALRTAAGDSEGL